MSLAEQRILEIVGGTLFFAALAAIPWLTVLAFRGWAKPLRADLPRWRSVLGAASILATFLSWLIFVGNCLLIIGRPSTHDDWLWLEADIVTLTIGFLLAFALRSPPRAQVLLACLLMIYLTGSTLIID